MYQFPTADSNF